LEERLQTLPDVQSVSWTSNLPLGLSQRSRGVIIDGHEPSPDGEPIHIACDVVSPEYFTTMGIPVLQGRAFTRHDDENAPKVVIINEAMAQLYWPGENPIGKRFRLAGKEPTPVEVVGVVRTGKYRTLGERPRPYLHMPLAQQYCAAPTLVIHTAGNPKSFIPTLRRVMREVDDNVPFIEVKTMQEHMHLMVMPQRVAATVLGTMGVLALILAAVGLYGVMSYSVSHRTQEIGIRMALGARCNDVLRLVVRQGMALTGVGMAVGLIASLGLSHFLSYLLYGVGAADPLTFAGITLFLALVALLACYVPARRAAKVDPMEALRYE
jgi:predicted permease